MSNMRTAETQAYYEQVLENNEGLPLSAEPSIKEWDNWRLINNRFPYDRVLTKHVMLLPHRKVADFSGLTMEEVQDLFWLIGILSKEYDVMVVNLPTGRSVLDHFHIHFGIYKR